jgi:Phosphotransferase enzyme family
MGAKMQDITGLDVPTTLQGALDPSWLSTALGKQVQNVEVLEVIRTVATKLRFAVTFAGGGTQAFCLKGFLDVDAAMAAGGATTVLEADFYRDIAARVALRAPPCIATIIDRAAPRGIVIMRDLITDGAHFCTALEAFSPDQAALSLEQLALLHAAPELLETRPWIKPRVAQMANAQYIPQPQLQEMLNGPRGEGLPNHTRNAGRLIAGVKALAETDTTRPQTLVHGDYHAGNVYITAAGPGMIDWQLLQKGSWVLDVAYHINAVCDVAVAAREERRLLAHYLHTARGLGCPVPAEDQAWAAYREAVVYGYYLWSITRRVDPAIINVFVNRLGNAVTRHESFSLLGL